MKSPTPSSAALGLLSCLMALPALRAQEAKTKIRLVPKANETFRFEAAQDMEMEVEAEGIIQPGVSAPIKLVTKTFIAFTEKTGPQKEDGEIDAEITYDKITSEQTMNGKSLPGNNLGTMLLGKTITFTFSREGKIADVKVPPDIDLSGETLKEMMNSFYGHLPSIPMAVGDTAAMPFSMPLPIPTPGIEPLNITGETKYRLLEVSTEGSDTLANIEQAIEAKLVRTVDVQAPQGSAKVDIDFRVSGTGKLRLNLGKGVLRENGMQLTIDGNMVVTPDTPGAASQTLRMHGISKMTSSGIY